MSVSPSVPRPAPARGVASRLTLVTHAHQILDVPRQPTCTADCRRYSVRLFWGEIASFVLHDPLVHEAVDRGGVVRSGPLAVDLEACRVQVDGTDTYVTPTEARLLMVIARKHGRLARYAEIEAAVWQPGYLDYAYHDKEGEQSRYHLIRVHMCRLRQRLGVAAALLETVPTRGYRLRIVPPTGEEGVL